MGLLRISSALASNRGDSNRDGNAFRLGVEDLSAQQAGARCLGGNASAKAQVQVVQHHQRSSVERDFRVGQCAVPSRTRPIHHSNDHRHGRRALHSTRPSLFISASLPYWSASRRLAVGVRRFARPWKQRGALGGWHRVVVQCRVGDSAFRSGRTRLITASRPCNCRLASCMAAPGPRLGKPGTV